MSNEFGEMGGGEWEEETEAAWYDRRIKGGREKEKFRFKKYSIAKHHVSFKLKLTTSGL